MKPQNFSTVNVMHDCNGYAAGIYIRYAKEDLILLRDAIDKVLEDGGNPTWDFKTLAGIFEDPSPCPFRFVVEDYPKARKMRLWNRSKLK